MDEQPYILVIEDDANTRSLLIKLCGNLGFAGVELEQAIFLPRILRRQPPPSAVLLDINMPGWNGRQMANLIRKHETARTPIVIYSALPASELEEISQEIGAQASVSKSRGPLELMNVLKRLLSSNKANS